MKKNPFFGHGVDLNLVPVLASPATSKSDLQNASDEHLLFSQGTDEGEKKTVRAQRRRRTTSTDAKDRARAETPQRRKPAAQRQARPEAQGTGGTTGSARPSAPRPADLPSFRPLLSGLRLSPMVLIGLLVLLAICCLILMLLPGPEETVYNPPIQATEPPVLIATRTAEPATPVSAVASPKPFIPPSTSSGEQTWLVMLYQDADDKILEHDIYLDLNEAERVGSTSRVHIVAQVDRYKGGYQGDGNWSTARRFYLIQDQDLDRVRSPMIEDLGEVNMSDGDTLVDFVTWAFETYPADKHVLILSDHGMGWPGGWSDPDPGGRGDPSIPLAAALGNQMYLMELDKALEEIRDRTGLQQFELIGLDACLMGHLEVLSALMPHARYAVASQETEPALGWAYTGFLERLVRNPDVDGADLGQFIVDTYIQYDQRIVDDQARAEFLRQGSPMGGLMGLLGGPSAEQLASQMAHSSTLSAVDLAALPELLNSLNDLCHTLQGEGQPAVARARTYAQSFTSVFGQQAPPSYIDLGHFVQLLVQETSSRNLAQAADRVLASLDRAVIAEKHGSKKPGASGISIYFPNSQLYSSPVTGAQSYTAIARRFAEISLWDDFLAYHYTGLRFEPTVGQIVVPEPGTGIRAPGTGKIQVSPITLSNNVAAPGQPIVLSTDIGGQNIGYVYLFVGFYDQSSRSIFVADRDYLEGEDTKEIDGVYYPDWGEEAEFTIEFEWEPIVFAINDGTSSVVALFAPQSYGVSFEQAIYTVDGIYTYADGGESRHARLYFRDGMLRQVFGFTGQDGTGAPREITPQSGDRFTVLETWLDLDASGRVSKTATQEGGTLTFGAQMFMWEDLDAAPGPYIVGFVVEDLDGNLHKVYDHVLVE